jgi:hypothetical protein
VLTSGPVHEAFAETVVFDPEPDVVIMQPPSYPIDEEPPDQVPDGPNMTWIPGYWAWDDDRDDYLWISGVWRSVPPGRRYVPGFWARIGHGFPARGSGIRIVMYGGLATGWKPLPIGCGCPHTMSGDHGGMSSWMAIGIFRLSGAGFCSPRCTSRRTCA